MSGRREGAAELPPPPRPLAPLADVTTASSAAKATAANSNATIADVFADVSAGVATAPPTGTTPLPRAPNRNKRLQSTLSGLFSGGEKGGAVGNRSVEDLVRENIKTLTPYRCARDDYEEGVLLDANENSIGATVAKPPDTRELNRYPCPYQWELKALIAKHRSE